MIRHSYVHCTTCHFSPVGGGAMTEYGREMSKEVLSAHSAEGEQNVGHGLIAESPLPGGMKSWIKGVGGDFRAVQYHRETAAVKEGDFFPMQIEVEPVIGQGPVVASISAGLVRDRKSLHWGIRQGSIIANLSEQFPVRVGQFKQTVGINLPEHTAWVKRDLGFGEGTESPGADAHWLGEKLAMSVGVKWPKSDWPSSRKEVGTFQSLSLMPEIYSGASFKFTLGRYAGQNLEATGRSGREIYSISALMGFTHSLYSLIEINFQRAVDSSGTASHGRVEYQKIGYELSQGLHLFLLREFSHLSLENPTASKIGWGGGASWYPRPHFEIQGIYEKQKIRAISEAYGSYAWLLLHYYL